ncbi:MAG: hypothetical protein Ct9H300mP19_01150 [Dehalococcoidia bacterium]|nr:MAG: hypothetical protein Ct9H300mP19_01150 [Dehalococcoidia bacterium]
MVVIINWVGILPGVGSVGRIETIEEWVHHHLPKVEAKVQEKHPEYTPVQTEAAALVHLLEDHGEDTFVAFDGSIVPPRQRRASQSSSKQKLLRLVSQDFIR